MMVDTKCIGRTMANMFVPRDYLDACPTLSNWPFKCTRVRLEELLRRLYSLSFQLLHLYVELYGAQYIGVFDQLPKPTESAIISSFERVILTSAPYQNFLMQMREISLWKQPKRSAGYMATYLLVWWYDCLTGLTVRLPFALSVAMVVSNFLQGNGIADLQADG
jgi:hypothetical protein